MFFFIIAFSIACYTCTLGIFFAVCNNCDEELQIKYSVKNKYSIDSKSDLIIITLKPGEQMPLMISGQKVMNSGVEMRSDFLDINIFLSLFNSIEILKKSDYSYSINNIKQNNIDYVYPNISCVVYVLKIF